MVLLYYEHISNVRLWEHKATKKYRKYVPKSLPKRGPNPLKIDAKNVLFFNIGFFGFWHGFWKVLGLQLGAKLAPNRILEVGGSFFWAFEHKTSLKIASWSFPDSILEAPGLDFRGSGINFYEIFSCFWPCMPRTCRVLVENLMRFCDVCLDWYACFADVTMFGPSLIEIHTCWNANFVGVHPGEK